MRLLFYSPFLFLLTAGCDRTGPEAGWSGIDRSTAFMLCGVSTPFIQTKANSQYNLTISPAFGTPWLMRIYDGSTPRFELLTKYEFTGSTYTIQVTKKISSQTLSQFVHALDDSGLMASQPEELSRTEDGLWLGFEYSDGSSYLAYGSNDDARLELVYQNFLSVCGEECTFRWSLPIPLDVDTFAEECVPILQGNTKLLDDFVAARLGQ